MHPRPQDAIRAIVAEMQAQRKAAQPTNKRTFGSVFKNPEHELSAGRMLEACGLKGFRIGGAQISPRHANFIENADGARTADALALMTEARRRAREQFGVELEHEVQLLGVAFREVGPSAPAAKSASVAGEDRTRRAHGCRRGRPATAGDADHASISRGSIPSGRATVITLIVVALAAGVYLRCARKPGVRGRHDRRSRSAASGRRLRYARRSPSSMERAS